MIRTYYPIITFFTDGETIPNTNCTLMHDSNWCLLTQLHSLHHAVHSKTMTDRPCMHATADRFHRWSSGHQADIHVCILGDLSSSLPGSDRMQRDLYQISNDGAGWTDNIIQIQYIGLEQFIHPHPSIYRVSLLHQSPSR